jgi:monothiol glutaredoxin
MSDEVQSRIQTMVDEHKVMLFMKGTPDHPQCGFSMVATNILKDSGFPFAAFNVLSDPAVRAGIKTFGNWPTIPQLYVNGELVGGSDIIKSLYESGEIKEVLSA